MHEHTCLAFLEDGVRATVTFLRLRNGDPYLHSRHGLSGEPSGVGKLSWNLDPHRRVASSRTNDDTYIGTIKRSRTRFNI